MKKSFYIKISKYNFNLPSIYETIEDALKYYRKEDHIIYKVDIELPVDIGGELLAEEVDV